MCRPARSLSSWRRALQPLSTASAASYVLASNRQSAGGTPGGPGVLTWFVEVRAGGHWHIAISEAVTSWKGLQVALHECEESEVWRPICLSAPERALLVATEIDLFTLVDRWFHCSVELTETVNSMGNGHNPPWQNPPWHNPPWHNPPWHNPPPCFNTPLDKIPPDVIPPPTLELASPVIGYWQPSPREGLQPDGKKNGENICFLVFLCFVFLYCFKWSPSVPVASASYP